jgi:hypothetical protein
MMQRQTAKASWNSSMQAARGRYCKTVRISRS